MSSTRIGQPVFMMDVKVSKDKQSKWIEITSCYLKQNQKLCIKMKKVIDRGKRSKALSEVKSVENILKNLQSFLEISPAQKEILLSHRLQDHAYE